MPRRGWGCGRTSLAPEPVEKGTAMRARRFLTLLVAVIGVIAGLCPHRPERVRHRPGRLE